MVSALVMACALSQFSASAPPSETRSSAQSTVTSPARPPLSPEAHGDVLMARKMYSEAIEVYKEGPTDSAVLANKIGIAYHHLLQLDNARRQYQRAMKLDREYPEAVNNLGTIYYAQKRFRRAIGLYKRALKLRPNSASFYSNMGMAYFGRKDYQKAAEAFQQALTLDPRIFEHRNTGGTLLLERSVEDRARLHYYLARTYAKAGQNELALLYIRKSLEEGFKERRKFQDEPEFAGLRELPEFKQLLALEPRVL